MKTFKAFYTGFTNGWLLSGVQCLIGSSIIVTTGLAALYVGTKLGIYNNEEDL